MACQLQVGTLKRQFARYKMCFLPWLALAGPKKLFINVVRLTNRYRGYEVDIDCAGLGQPEQPSAAVWPRALQAPHREQRTGLS